MKSRQRAARELDELPMPLVVRDDRGRILHANEAARRALGLADEEVAQARLVLVTGGDADPAAPVSAERSYLLSVGRSARGRVDARRIEAGEGFAARAGKEVGTFGGADVLLLRAAPGTGERTGAGAVEPDVRGAMLPRAAGRIQTAGSRSFAAEVARRLRRWPGGFGLRFTSELRRRERIIHADAAAIARVLAVACGKLAAARGGGAVVVRATEGEGWLRFVADGALLRDRGTAAPRRTLDPAEPREDTEVDAILREHHASLAVAPAGAFPERFILSLPAGPALPPERPQRPRKPLPPFPHGR